MNITKTLAACAAIMAAPASSGAVELGTYGDWAVSADRYDNGTEFCQAMTFTQGMLFGLFFEEYGPLTIQFYFPDAGFGNGGVMNVTVQVDDRSPWTLNDAQLSDQSIFFSVPDNSDAHRFLSEMWRGRIMRVLGANGERLWQVSLRGSSQAMAMLGKCRGMIE